MANSPPFTWRLRALVVGITMLPVLLVVILLSRHSSYVIARCRAAGANTSNGSSTRYMDMRRRFVPRIKRRRALTPLAMMLV